MTRCSGYTATAKSSSGTSSLGLDPAPCPGPPWPGRPPGLAAPAQPRRRCRSARDSEPSAAASDSEATPRRQQSLIHGPTRSPRPADVRVTGTSLKPGVWVTGTGRRRPGPGYRAPAASVQRQPPSRQGLTRSIMMTRTPESPARATELGRPTAGAPYTVAALAARCPSPGSEFESRTCHRHRDGGSLPARPGGGRDTVTDVASESESARDRQAARAPGGLRPGPPRLSQCEAAEAQPGRAVRSSSHESHCQWAPPLPGRYYVVSCSTSDHPALNAVARNSRSESLSRHWH
jgi:hypothetical protein